MHCHAHVGPTSTQAHDIMSCRLVGRNAGRVGSGKSAHDAHTAPFFVRTMYSFWVQCTSGSVSAASRPWLDCTVLVTFDVQPETQTLCVGGMFEQFRQSVQLLLLCVKC